MELHQLRYFVAVVDEENFTRAAERCLVSQPSLSQQIIKLEKELGQPLLERLGRRVQLTDAGRLLYDKALRVLSTVDGVQDELAELSGEGRGRLAVGAMLTAAPYLLPKLVRRFGRRFPHAEIILHEDLTEQIVDRLMQGELDVGILALPLEQRPLETTELFTEELLLAVPKGHRLASKKRVTMADVAREPFVLIDPLHCLGQQVLAFCLERDCRPRVVCRSSQILTVQQLVGSGVGISLLPECAARADRTRKCAYRSLSADRPTRTLVLAWRKGRHQSRVVREFIRDAEQHAK